MPHTYTTDRILLEFCVLTQRPDSSRHSLWGIFNHRYLLLSISLVSESLAIDFAAQNASLPTPQTEFSSSFVSSPNVRPTPDTPYGASLIIGISCYRYFLYRYLIPLLSFSIGVLFGVLLHWYFIPLLSYSIGIPFHWYLIPLVSHSIGILFHWCLIPLVCHSIGILFHW